MTAKEFDLILFESFEQEAKQTYFKAKRKQYKCNPDEYFAGLMDSFKRLNDEVNKTDYLSAIVTTPEGEEREYELRSDSLSEQRIYLETIGKVSFPNKKTIDIRDSSGILKQRITANLMAELWQDLQKYCQSIIDKKSKKLQGLKDDDLLTSIEMLKLDGLRLQNEVNKKIINSLPDKNADHSELWEALKKYISGISSAEFTSIIEYHSLIPGKSPAKWIGEKVDACYFCDYLNMTYAEWNKCFYFTDGKKLRANNKDRLCKGSPIIEILKAHVSK